MQQYSRKELQGVLEVIDAAAIPNGTKNKVHEMADDLIILGEKVKSLEAQVAKDKENRVNASANEPSGKKPEWEKGKDPKPPKGKGNLGGRREGSGNQSKQEITPDRHVHNSLGQCPRCGKDLSREKPVGENKRIIEDIEELPEKTEVTEETSDRKWCSDCETIVSAKSTLALDGSDIGLRASVLMAWLWVVPAMSLPNIVAYLSCFMRLDISTSGISKLLIRIAKILLPVQEEILGDIRS